MLLQVWSELLPRAHRIHHEQSLPALIRGFSGLQEPVSVTVRTKFIIVIDRSNPVPNRSAGALPRIGCSTNQPVLFKCYTDQLEMSARDISDMVNSIYRAKEFRHIKSMIYKTIRSKDAVK